MRQFRSKIGLIEQICADAIGLYGADIARINAYIEKQLAELPSTVRSKLDAEVKLFLGQAETGPEPPEN